MKVTGIIAEYNPLHKGHEYHIRMARETTGADYCIVIMSGNFVQRGAPALTDKYTRTHMALTAGADLVLELPAPYACASAEIFAEGAVRILDGLGIVNTLCFGSESGDVTPLKQIGAYLTEESAEYQAALQGFLKDGLSFPKARNQALCSLEPRLFENAAFKEALTKPNNILGIEYCKALYKRRSSIEPVTVKREGNDYHDTSLSSAFASASAIRKALKDSELSQIEAQLPHASYQILKEHWGQTCPITADDFSLLIQYALLQYAHCLGGYTAFADVTSDLSDKIKKNLPAYQNLTSFCEALKTKDITASRLSRSLFHILLGITREQMRVFTSPDFSGYARILGFRKNASDLLSLLKKQTEIPLISKPADAKRILGEDSGSFSLFEAETHACELYNAVAANKYGVSIKHEYTNSVIIL